jgi:excisionase family DNA binding protein
MRNELREGEAGKGKGFGGSRELTRYSGLEERYCMTVPEAARRLGISRNFGYELVRRGQLPVIRFGKRLLIPKVALEKMLEEGARVNNPRRD